MSNRTGPRPNDTENCPATAPIQLMHIHMHRLVTVKCRTTGLWLHSLWLHSGVTHRYSVSCDIGLGLTDSAPLFGPIRELARLRIAYGATDHEFNPFRSRKRRSYQSNCERAFWWPPANQCCLSPCVVAEDVRAVIRAESRPRASIHLRLIFPITGPTDTRAAARDEALRYLDVASS